MGRKVVRGLVVGLLSALVAVAMLAPAPPAGAIRGGDTASQYSWIVAFVKPNDGKPALRN